MYFKDIKIKDLGLDLKLEDFYAHRKDSKEKETLLEHLNKTQEYFEFIIEQKNLDDIFKNFEDEITAEFSDSSKKLFREMILNSIYYHDIGKINLSFQKRVMDNEDVEIEDSSDKQHSVYSAVIFLKYYMEEIALKITDKKEKEELYTIAALLSYCISAHHKSKNEIFEKIIEILDIMDNWNEKPNLSNVHKMNTDIEKNRTREAERFLRDDTQTEYSTSIQLHFYEKIKSESEEEEYSDEIMNYIIFLRYIYGLMVQADFYATADYMNGPVKDLGLIEDIEEFYKPYKESEVYKGIQQYRSYLDGVSEESPFSENNINRLRSDIYIEAEKNIIKKFENSNIFQLEAPTGSGKTNTSINLAFKCLEMDKKINKIFYIFPFNNLVEQTYSTFKQFYSENKEVLEKIAVVNSITSPETVKKGSNYKIYDEYKEETIDYNKMLLDREFLHYPITITTNIMFFKILFGTRKEDFFPLSLLANSVIIMDEIHTYKNAIWTYIIKFLNKYSKLLNIKILIMSATLPEFKDLLSEDISNVENLIDNPKKYYEDSLFKDRVKYDFSLIDIREKYKDDKEYIKLLQEKMEEETKDNRKNVLFEFISKKQAIDFYLECLELKKEDKMYKDKKIYLITGDDSRIDRENVLYEAKKKDAENIILIATQCIEAGIDLDMDLGFKDISLLDSEEQFLGRINRSSRKDSGKVYFFHLTDIGMIYDDMRANSMFTLKRDKNRKILINKNFKSYYKKINAANEECIKNYFSKNGIKNFYDSAARLDLKSIGRTMTLIDDCESFTVFLARDIDIEDKVIDGEEVWKEYRNMLEARKYMDYSEWKIKLMEIKKSVSLFTYQIYKGRKPREVSSCTEKLGNIYYYDKETSKTFFREVKIEEKKKLIFDRKKYIEKIN